MKQATHRPTKGSCSTSTEAEITLTYDPGSPAEVDLKTATVLVNGQAIDILDGLDKAAIERLTEEVIEQELTLGNGEEGTR
jgi:hypothetical protein